MQDNNNNAYYETQTIIQLFKEKCKKEGLNWFEFLKNKDMTSEQREFLVLNYYEKVICTTLSVKTAGELVPFEIKIPANTEIVFSYSATCVNLQEIDVSAIGGGIGENFLFNRLLGFYIINVANNTRHNIGFLHSDTYRRLTNFTFSSLQTIEGVLFPNIPQYSTIFRKKTWNEIHYVPTGKNIIQGYYKDEAQEENVLATDFYSPAIIHIPFIPYHVCIALKTLAIVNRADDRARIEL
ncbi:MAG: hypothetical protein QXS90_00375 [Candidatus Diapherotrites archaeon]